MKYCMIIMLYLVHCVKICNFAQIDYFNTIKENTQIPCETDEHCLGEDYTCINNVCVCKNTHNCKSSTFTHVVSKINGNCTLFSKCSIENSYCNNGKCECANNTISSRDGRRCLNLNEELELPCDESTQCHLLNAECIHNKCRCGSGKHAINGKCFNTIGLGFICEADEECQNTEFSNCKNYFCVCNEHYIENHNYSTCLLKAKDIFSPCSEDIQCSGTLGIGSVCYRESCRCKDLYNYRSSSNKCVQDYLLDFECESHIDCHQPGSDESRLECIIGVCKCKSLYKEIYGECIKNSNCCSLLQLNRFIMMVPFIFSYALLYTIH